MNIQLQSIIILQNNNSYQYLSITHKSVYTRFLIQEIINTHMLKIIYHIIR